MLYTDDEAEKLVNLAESIVAPGQKSPKSRVLRRLGIDPRRLGHHHASTVMNVLVERAQLSERYDLTWMVAIQDDKPPEAEDREIYGVRVVPRFGSDSR